MRLHSCTAPRQHPASRPCGRLGVVGEERARFQLSWETSIPLDRLARGSLRRDHNRVRFEEAQTGVAQLHCGASHSKGRWQYRPPLFLDHGVLRCSNIARAIWYGASQLGPRRLPRFAVRHGKQTCILCRMFRDQFTYERCSPGKSPRGSNSIRRKTGRSVGSRLLRSEPRRSTL